MTSDPTRAAVSVLVDKGLYPVSDLADRIDDEARMNTNGALRKRSRLPTRPFRMALARRWRGAAK